MTKNKYSKYIKEAYSYYENETSICPDAEDIASYVADCIEEVSGYSYEIDDEQYKEILKEIAGE